MVSKNDSSLLFFLLLLIVTLSLAQARRSNPKAILFETTKDESSKLHLTTIHQKNSPAEIKLLVDLEQTLWVDCENGYKSSSYKQVHCNSTACRLAESHACGDGCMINGLPKCTHDTCFNFPMNPITGTSYDGGSVSADQFMFQSTNGLNPGNFVTVPKFIFSCLPSFIAGGLPGGAIGVAGFGLTNISLPAQLSKTFNFPTKLGVCLSSSTKSKGVIIVGDGPYYMLPNIDITRNLTFTPLIVKSNGGFIHISRAEYYITVKSIRINGKKIKISKELLSVTNGGDGGTKISTYSPYTILEPSIYKAVTEAFVKQLSTITNRVPAVEKLGVCFNSSGIARTRVGPAVPTIDLVLQNNVVWRIFGSNSMVQVNEKVMCLGFVEGLKYGVSGSHPASIDIGAHQLEDNLLQFDIARSRLGFSSSLLLRQTTCSNFNFTSIV